MIAAPAQTRYHGGMDRRLRRDFDLRLETIFDELPDHLHDMLEEIPVIVEDEPSPDLLQDMGLDITHADLCGLHWGVALTHRSVMASGELPDRIMLFRGPIMRLADAMTIDQDDDVYEATLTEQIRITLLHEIGHHFGLDEDDLASLGYA